MTLDNFRILREGLLDRGDGLVDLPFERQAAGLLQEIVEFDLVLGITRDLARRFSSD